MTAILNKTENITDVRADISAFGKVDRSKHPTKLAFNEFYTKENWINKVGSLGSIEKRNGIQVYNTNVISAKPIINLFEAKLNSGYFMLGKDNTGAGSSLLKYVASPYTAAWSSVKATEYAGFYRFVQFKNAVYIANILDGSNNLLAGEVWQGTTNIFEHGALPTDTDGVTLSLSVVTGGLTTANYYYYIVQNLYDNYQASASFEYVAINLTGAATAVSIAFPSVPNTRIKARKLFRSTAQSAVGSATPFQFPPPNDFYYLATIPVTASNTYVDTKADTALGASYDINDFFDQKRPFRSKLVTVANDRLIQANLEISPLRYSAITAGNISLVGSNGAGTLTNSGVYNYRFYKAYANHSGGRYGYIVGEYVDKQITLGVAEDTVTISLSAVTDFDDWCNYVYVERTADAGSVYKPLGVFKKGGSFVDTYPDTAGLFAGSDTSKIDIIRADGFSDTTKADVIANTKFKSMLAVSEAGNGDLIPNANLKFVDSKDNVGITGVFSENTQVVIFTAFAIYSMDTRALSSDYWTIDKLIDNIGAAGQDTAPKTETVGHNGILQLPNGAGYIFFNRASSASATTPINIYFWDGRSAPVIISNEIYNYVNGQSSLQVRGMCYDFVRKWVWINCVTASKQLFVYDLEFGEWYVFTLDTALNYYDMLCTEDGKIILGNDAGELCNYTTAYNDATSAVPKSIIAILVTKTFDEHDADLNVKRISVMCDTSTAGLSLTQTITHTTQNGVSSDLSANYSDATSGKVIHRTTKKVNQACRRFYVTFSNSETKNIIINKIDIDYKVLHAEQGGI